MPKAVLSILLLCIVNLGSDTAVQASSEDDTPLLTPEAFYQRFNMRTILSSVGPRLKYYCQSYPKEYFDIEEKRSDFLKISINKTTFWEIFFEESNQVKLFNYILGATYNTESILKLYFNEEFLDWRSYETFIEKNDKCVHFQKEAY